MSDFDGAWKEAMEFDLPGFLAFFYPEARQAIDWATDYEPLEQELRELLPQGETGRRLCDKLVKARLKDSGDPVYLHVEVQNQAEADFERRVYVYNYRAEDKYNNPVVSLVVLGDDSPSWRPRAYVFERWGCKKTLEFPAFKLLDYRGREAELEAHANPFGLLVLAHLLALRTRQDMEARRDGKVRLIQTIYGRGLEPEDRRQWLRLFDWVLQLPLDQEQRFIEETTPIKEGKTMAYVTSWERLGMRTGLVQGIEVALRIKFGAADPAFLDELRHAELAPIERVLKAIPTATSVDELRQAFHSAGGQGGQG